MLKNKIINLLEKSSKDKIISDIRIGLKYTCVEIDDLDIGLSPTPCKTRLKASSCFDDLYILSGKPATEALKHLNSTNILLSSIGLATANALINNYKEECITGDLLKFLELKPDDTVAIIGCINHITNRIKESTKKVHYFSNNIEEGSLPLTTINKKASECQVALIAAELILEDNFEDYILELNHCRELVIVGPSLPLIPEIFNHLNITLLSGMQVVNNKKIKTIISQGLGITHFKESVRKVNIGMFKT